jgi:hypothetical protein
MKILRYTIAAAALFGNVISAMPTDTVAMVRIAISWKCFHPVEFSSLTF